MAQIVFGAGLSHSPLLPMESHTWFERARQDLENPALNLSDGRILSYDDLLREVGPRYQHLATEEVFLRQAAVCQAALDRLADELEQAAPDLVVIVGDDHEELFAPGLQPAISIFYGEQAVTLAADCGGTTPDWIKDVYRGFAMDRAHHFPGQRPFALELIQGLLDRDVDVGVAASVKDPKVAGLGHAFGFVAARLFKGRPIPMVPILLNTYYPPNVISARRAFEVGEKLRQTIEASATPHRVALIASGGLSHFVTDEALDRRVIRGLAQPEGELLRALPREALISGTSEILNWVLVAGALRHCTVRWVEYEPVYRTPAGSGIGLCFARWSQHD